MSHSSVWHSCVHSSFSPRCHRDHTNALRIDRNQTGTAPKPGPRVRRGALLRNASRLTPVNAGTAGCVQGWPVTGGRQSMAISRLERSEWGGFCFRASHIFLGKHADIEVASLEVGFQLEARRLPLVGMFYDPGSDVLRLLLGELN